ncbi:hypothetical protein AOQ71_05155 [Bradyrhizobium manausense]|uniref:Uncharacterized protein n=1 Tax=Bradyrhizobium manausense TaxID=989370 RepID=A0A0R3E889_9BRAD|nr:hypothetical protein AOQ71_05155 [Bradyrhizobium manausense]
MRTFTRAPESKAANKSGDRRLCFLFEAEYSCKELTPGIGTHPVEAGAHILEIERMGLIGEIR